MAESKLTPVRNIDMVQQVMASLRTNNPVVYEHLRDIFMERRELRRIQAESAAEAHQAARLLGRCTELTSIVNELFNSR